MKIYKSTSLEATHRVVSRTSESQDLSLGLIYGFSLSDTLESRPVKQLVWEYAKKAMGEKVVFDEGLPKHQSEFLAFGSCFRSDDMAQPVSASITVGSIEKQLVVYGDRYFQASGLISTPKEFHEMPITPDYAFGGDGFSLNPKGKGATAVKPGELDQLPNIETLQKLMVHSGDVVPVSGFWSLPTDHPERTSLLGKFDQNWFKSRWPNLPLDTQPDYYQVAPRDQRFKGFFSGKELITISNMHQSHREISCKLPGVRARLIYEDLQGTGNQLHEVATSCETLYLFPNELFGLLLYRGIIPLREKTDVNDLRIYADIEDMDSPIGAASEVVNRVLLGVTIPTISVSPKPKAEEVDTSDKDTSINAKTPTNQAEVASDKVPPNSDMDMLNSKMKEVDKSMNDLLKKLGLSKSAIEKLTEEHKKKSQAEPVDIGKALKAAQKGMEQIFKKFNINEKDLIAKMISDPKTMQAGQSMLQTGSGFAGIFKEMEEAVTKLTPPSTEASDQDHPSSEPDSGTAAEASHEQTPVVTEEYNRQLIMSLLAEGHRDFSGLKLSGLNLSGLDLSGANFSRCQMHDTDLSQTTLQQSTFDQALLMGTLFSGSTVTKSSFKAVSAQSTNWDGAVLQECIFTDADCSKSSFAGVKFNSVTLSGTAVFDCNFATAQFNACNAAKAHFDGANLSAAKIFNSNFSSVTFVKACCIGSEFVGSDLTKSNFFGVSGNGALFKNCNADESLADKSTVFSRSNFLETTLNRANWQGIGAQGSNFINIKMSGALFSKSTFNFCRFESIDGRGAYFDSCVFENADLLSSNFMESNLKAATLENTKIIGCNLFAANLLQANVRNMIVDRSNIERTILAVRQG